MMKMSPDLKDGGHHGPKDRLQGDAERSTVASPSGPPRPCLVPGLRESYLHEDEKPK